MSSITANSPSPHFKFPCPSSTSPLSSPSQQQQQQQQQQEQDDYFAFNSHIDVSQTSTSTTSTAQIEQHQKLQQPRQGHQRQYSQKNVPNVIYEEDDKPDDENHCYFFQPRLKPSSNTKTHNKLDSSSSISTNSSDQTLVDTLHPKSKLLQSYDSCDTLFEFNNSSSSPSSSSSPMMKPPPPPPFKPSFASSPIFNTTKTPSSATDQTFHSRGSLSSPHVTPTRPIIRHSLSLSQDSSRFNSTRFNKDMIYQIPSNSTFITPQDLTKLITDTSTIDKNNFIIIDVRPFGEFCKNHIKNSINICLSSTLLKRSSFDLKRCIDSLPTCDKLLFSTHFANNTNEINNQNGFPSVILYDSSTILPTNSSLSLAYTASKFTNDKEWNSPVYLLKGGFQEFSSNYPNFLSNFDDLTNNNNNSPNLQSTTQQQQQQFANNSTFSSLSPGSSPASSTHSISSIPLLPPRPQMSTLSKLTSSPILARFILPSPSNAVFKTRHNEELLTSRPDRSLSLHESNLTTQEQQIIPNWMLSTIGDDNGCASIAEKFSYLERSERSRLRKVFSTNTSTISNFNDNNNNDDDDLDHPKISSGVELGNKNRYKDILPYEHSRVKLTKETGCDYINASYISPKFSNNKYIATQGPLNATIGDFWSLVVSHRSPLILSLTAQNEGGVEKCAPFWESGIYKESSNLIKVETLEQDENFKINSHSESPMILRRLKITINDSIEHELLQIQVLSWPDYGASIAKGDLISLVALKKSILKFSNYKDAPIIVHCSAGCGRTGTFCAIDSTIDFLISNKDNDNKDDIDPILTTVDCFRRQRISMVQTMRQYLLIYDTVLLFLKGQLNSSNNDNWDLKLDRSIEQTTRTTTREVKQTTENSENYDILIHFIQDLKSSFPS